LNVLVRILYFYEWSILNIAKRMYLYQRTDKLHLVAFVQLFGNTQLFLKQEISKGKDIIEFQCKNVMLHRYFRRKVLLPNMNFTNAP